MNLSLRHTLLTEAQELFLREGISNLSDARIIEALDISPSTFREMFQDKADLLMQATLHDMERQKKEHAELFARVSNPVERLLSLLEMGIRDLKKLTPSYISDLLQHYPEVWAKGMENLEQYSAPQTHSLLNEAVVQKLMRGDMNIGLVTKIIIEQLNMMLNEQAFPPSRYNPAEVFRNIYLYYIRGLCTEEGIRSASAHFARM